MSRCLPLLDCVYFSSHQQSTNKKSEKVLNIFLQQVQISKERCHKNLPIFPYKFQKIQQLLQNLKKMSNTRRWRQQVPPKCWLSFNRPQSITSLETADFIFRAIRTPNLITYEFHSSANKLYICSEKVHMLSKSLGFWIQPFTFQWIC